ncbi:unnamed protein product [Sphagnum balticum]
MSKSEFADFQKIRVQEDPTKIPPGAMPRSIDVVLRMRDLSYKLIFQGINVKVENNQFDELEPEEKE